MKQKICVHTEGSYEIKSLTPQLSTHPTNLKNESRSLSKKIWANDVITWKLETDTTSIEGRKIEQEVFKLAFLQIGLYIPNRIVQLNKQTADADIRINFSKTDSFWTSHPSTLAFAYPPADGIGGDITFNTKNYIWTPDGKPMSVTKALDLGLISGFQNSNNKLKTFDVQHTACHEGLHAMGVPHIEKSACDGAVMNPYYNGQRIMLQCEIDYLQGMYGKKQPNATQLQNLRKRIQAGVPY